MSDGTEVEVIQEEDKAAVKRKTLTMGERIKVVNHLRAQVEPIVADSNAAVAALVSGATGIEINWQQLKYMIDDPSMAEWNLGTKVHVKSLLSGEDERWAAMEAKLAALTDRVLHLEANAQP